MNTTPTQMQFSKGQLANYQSNKLDSTSGEPIVGATINVTSTLVASNTPWFGMNAQIEQNTYSDGSPADSGFYSQDPNGDLYSRGFGLSAMVQQMNLTLKQVGFQFPDPGWLLQIRMASAKGISWTAYQKDTSITVNSLNVTIKMHDTVAMQDDSVYVLAGKSYAIKHARHYIWFTADYVLGNLAAYNGLIDTYVSADLAATVKNVVHQSALTISPTLAGVTKTGNRKMLGTLSLMVGHS